MRRELVRHIHGNEEGVFVVGDDKEYLEILGETLNQQNTQIVEAINISGPLPVEKIVDLRGLLQVLLEHYGITEKQFQEMTDRETQRSGRFVRYFRSNDSV